MIAIAASSGGLAALSTVLQDLPATLPAAVLVLQHASPGQRSYLSEILGGRTDLAVHQATEGMLLEDGVVCVAPPAWGSRRSPAGAAGGRRRTHRRDRLAIVIVLP